MDGRRGYGGNRKQADVALTAVALQDHLMRNILGDTKLTLTKSGPKPRSLNTRRKPPVVRSVVDCGQGYKKKAQNTTRTTEQEFTLDARPPAPTLAQRLGIIDAPRQLLSEDEWSVVKERSNKRDDSVLPCVICKEDFGNGQQVLLSCSHVFHRVCLQAFEKFSGKKRCPLCRKEQYQTRVVYEGARVHRHRCAVRIQAQWRGYVVRCWYRKLRETNPPKDPRLRKKYYEDKLATITDRMVRSLDTGCVADLFREIDQNVEASRRLFARMDVCQRPISDEDWASIEIKAMSRQESECPICLAALHRSDCHRDRSIPSQRKGQPHRHTVLLSCSHMFHLTCLETFEELADTGLMGMSSCPVCRSAYQKKILAT